MFNASKWGGCGIRGWRLLEEGPVTSVAIPLPWQVVLQHTRKFTLGRSFSNVGAVTTHALQLVIWRPIQTLTLGSNPSNVAAVTYHSVNLEVWWHIPTPTLGRSPTSVPAVTTHVLHLVVWRPIPTPTPGISLSNVKAFDFSCTQSTLTHGKSHSNSSFCSWLKQSPLG